MYSNPDSRHACQERRCRYCARADVAATASWPLSSPTYRDPADRRRWQTAKAPSLSPSAWPLFRAQAHAQASARQADAAGAGPVRRSRARRSIVCSARLVQRVERSAKTSWSVRVATVARSIPPLLFANWEESCGKMHDSTERASARVDRRDNSVLLCRSEERRVGKEWISRLTV